MNNVIVIDVMDRYKRQLTQFMTENGDDSILIHLLYQSIVDDDSLVLEEAVEVGIAMSRPGRSIHHKDLCQREANLLSQILSESKYWPA